MARRGVFQRAPQFLVLDGLLVGCAPAVRFPALQPFGRAVHHVAGIGMNDGGGRLFQSLQRPDHGLVGRGLRSQFRLKPLDLLLPERYRDVVVLAFPKPKGSRRITDVEEKAIYQRAPYSSRSGVKSSLPAPAS